ncbi:MAG: precorrin-2 C(20)-methyltransferase [Lachnospiraceae bacterium]|nr:precorrin-2 C(20)-methyltransferase [Lachnospiraceae bacterium]
MMQGVFYGVGVGPGSPELITIKALKIIRECDTIVLPSSPKEECRAYQIVKESFPEIDEKKLVAFEFPMSMNKQALDEYHRNTAAALLELCKSGEDIAFLTIGDPSIYSTYTYVAEILKDKGVECQIISGVPAFIASAAALNISLAEKNEEIHIIPGSGDVDEALKLPGTKIFMKNGRQFPKLLERLKRLEEKGQISVKAVSHCGMECEKQYQSAFEMDENISYLTTIVVKDI